MHLLEFLSTIEFNTAKRIRLILYKNRADVPEESPLTLFKGIFAFDNCDHILVFSETQNRQAHFVAAYKKTGIIQDEQILKLMDYPYPHVCAPYYSFYRFVKMDSVDDRIGRLIIHWGDYKKTMIWLRENNVEIIAL